MKNEKNKKLVYSLDFKGPSNRTGSSQDEEQQQESRTKKQRLTRTAIDTYSWPHPVVHRSLACQQMVLQLLPPSAAPCELLHVLSRAVQLLLADHSGQQTQVLVHSAAQIRHRQLGQRFLQKKRKRKFTSNVRLKSETERGPESSCRINTQGS